MSSIILAVSLVTQLGAATIAGRIAWLTSRRTWILICFALFLMAVRRTISLYETTIMDRVGNLGSEFVALIASVLIFAGTVAVWRRNRDLFAADQFRFDRETLYAPSDTMGTAILMAAITIVSATVLGFFTFSVSRNAQIERIFEANFNTAKALSSIADSPSIDLSSEERLALIQEVWAKVEHRTEGSYICIIDAEGRMLANTRNTGAIGKFFGDTPINDSFERYASINDILAAQTNWVGWHKTHMGEEQIAAFVYSDALASLVAVHVPRSSIEQEVLLKSAPLGITLAITLLVLLPSSLLVLYRAYRVALRNAQQGEVRYKAIVEDQTELICRFLPDGTYTFVNAAYCAYFGLTAEDYVGKKEPLHVAPEDRRTLMDHLAGLTPADPVASFDMRVCLPDGTRRWHRWTGHALTDAEGKITEYQGTGFDITEQRQAENRIAGLARIFEESVNEIYLFDVDTLLFTDVNQAALKNLGYTIEEMRVRTPLSIKPEFTQDTFEAKVAPLKDGRQGKIVFETVHLRKNGTLYGVEVYLQMIQEADGASFAAFVLDISERDLAHAQKEEFDARSTAIIQHAADGIMTVNEDGTIDSVNPVALSMFGYTEAELVGQNIRILLPDKGDGSVEEELKLETANGFPSFAGKTRDVRRRHKDGTLIPIRLSISEVVFGSRRLYTGVMHDLTEELKLKNQLMQAQKMDALGVLSGGIAHDFNNILQSIQGYTQIAIEMLGDANPTIEQSLREIETGAYRASDLVNQILAFSHKANVEVRATDLGTLLSDTLKFIRSTIPTTIQIDSSIDPDCGLVAANATQMHQIIVNLCTNSMHAMENKAGILTIWLEPVHIDEELHTLSGVIPPGEYVRLSIGDTGEGIPRASFELILDPFYTTKSVGKGTGLGLSVVHGIMKSMNGGMIIESAPDLGTTVRLLFPIHHDSAHHHEEPTRKVVDSSSHRNRKHLLVVDDEEAITRLLALAMTARGFTVDSFNDAEQALDAVRAQPKVYDAAVFDYTMPKMTGIDLAREVALLSPNLPIVLATGLLEQSKIDLTRPSNIVEIYRKPYSMVDLISFLNQLTDFPAQTNETPNTPPTRADADDERESQPE